MITLQVGVKILLKNAEGKYLLLRRSLETYPGVGGMWDIPGGRINPGKPLLENLKREVYEEAGLRLTGAPQLIAAQDILRKKNHHVVRLTYTGRARGKPRLDMKEHDMYKWCLRHELRKLKNVDLYLKQLLRGDSL